MIQLIYKKTCPIYASNRHPRLGCMGPELIKLTCDIAGGTWIPAPTTQQECLGIQRCYNLVTKQWTLHSASDCNACSLSFNSVFTWTPAAWQPGVMFRPQKNQTCSMVPVNQWITTLDATKMNTFFTDLITIQLIPIIKETLTCYFGPVLNSIKRFACDCGDVKAPTGTICYPIELITISSHASFTGYSQTHDNNDVSVTTDPTTITTSSDSTEMIIQKQDFNFPTSGYVQTTSLFGKTDSSDVPYIGCDGHNVVCNSCTPGQTVQLCLQKDKNFFMPAIINSVNFVTVSSTGVITKSSVIVTDSLSQTCGNVLPDSTVYYIAYYGPPGQIPLNTGSLFKISFFIFALTMIIIF